MSDSRHELASELRKLPVAERIRRGKEILAHARSQPPDARLKGKTIDDIVRMVKRTREEMAKERLASRP